MFFYPDFFLSKKEVLLDDQKQEPPIFEVKVGSQS